MWARGQWTRMSLAWGWLQPSERVLRDPPGTERVLRESPCASLHFPPPLSPCLPIPTASQALTAL